MQTIEVEYLDGEFSVMESVPSTIDEIVALGVAESAIVDLAVDNIRYRGKYPRVYRKLSEEVAKTFPVAVKEVKTVNGKEKKVMESANDHLRAFLVGRKDADGNIITPPPADSRNRLQELFEQLGVSEPLYFKGERSIGSGGKVAQMFVDTANSVVASGKEAAVVEKIESVIPGYKVTVEEDGTVSVESLARAISTFHKYNEREAKKKAVADLNAALVG